MVRAAKGVKAWRLRHYIPAEVFAGLHSTNSTVRQRAEDVIATFASLTKWYGYKDARRNGLCVNNHELRKLRASEPGRPSDERHTVGAGTCSLCALAEARAGSTLSVRKCPHCPLASARAGRPCTVTLGSESASPWRRARDHGDCQPMIDWLQYTLSVAISRWRSAVASAGG